ncbi:MAG: A/G-specific adenine glycosylase [Kangiellaceae bacterium]|nr:A/G-specific adenine glycosylase [Kangiellaceae bacterium]
MKGWQASTFAQKVIDYYEQHGRKHLPWQGTRDAYKIWLSEIMLQQTQVATVIPYFEKFIQYFPTVEALAEADNELVMHLWSGLGYYSRARNLHKAAKMVIQQFDGQFPQTTQQLEQLPGVGRSTAGAIAAFAYQQPTAILDGNVKRVLARCYAIQGWPGNGQVLKELWSRAEQNTPSKSTDKYNQAMMDLGAMVCTRTKPKCDICPLATKCLAHQHNIIDQCPGKKPKKARPSQSTYWLIYIRDGKVLLEKRPPSGIWGGLWSFPEKEQITDLEVSHELEPILHKFSHYDLHIQPLLVDNSPHINNSLQINESNNNDWFELQRLADIGLPAPVSKLLQQLASQ